MRYLSHSPAPPLDEYVENFWTCADTPPHRRERILPSGTIELVVNLREDEIRIYNPLNPDRCKRFSGAVVSGTYTGVFVIDPQQHQSILGVHFKPGSALAFLGTRASELRNTHVNLEALWGASAARLRERLCSAVTHRERFTVMEEELRGRLRGSLPEGHIAVPVALGLFGRDGTSPSVRDVAQRLDLSQRRLIQVFNTQVGLTPKLFCRVLRFQRARARIERMAAPDWAQMAVACGYYDQSHLIHDFREFSGLSPTDYLRQRSDRVLRHHVPIVG